MVLKSQSLAPFSSYSGRTYGLFGVGGNGSSGYNYGVFGQLSGNNYGAGVVGMISSSPYPDFYIQGFYAGYFIGGVKATSSMEAPAFIIYFR